MTNPNEETMKIGFISLGIMGAGMVSKFAVAPDRIKLMFETETK